MAVSTFAACPSCGKRVPVDNDCARCPNCGPAKLLKSSFFLPKDDLTKRSGTIAPLPVAPSGPPPRDAPREAQLNGLYAGASLGAGGLILAGMFAGELGVQIANGFVGALIGTVLGLVFGYIGAKCQTIFPMWMREWGLLVMLFSGSDDDYVKFMTGLGVVGGIASGFFLGMVLELSLSIALPIGALGAAGLFGLIGSMLARFFAELKSADEQYRRQHPS